MVIVTPEFIIEKYTTIPSVKIINLFTNRQFLEISFLKIVEKLK